MRASSAEWLARGVGFGVGLTAVALVIALVVGAAPVVILVFAAILLASALDPVVDALRSRLPIGRAVAILLVFACFLGITVGLLLLVVPAAFTQAEIILAAAPATLDHVRASLASVQPAPLERSLTALVDAAEQALRPAASPDPGAVVRVGLSVAEAAVGTATLLASVAFWLLERARVQRYVLAFAPASRRAAAREVWDRIEVRLGRWVRGELILMGAMALATGTAYFLIGVPSAIFLGLIAGLCEALPIIGPLIGAVPAILVALTVSPQLALVVLGIYVVLQFLEGNVLVPMVMRNTVGLSPFLVLVSLLVGSSIGGPVGALLAVPVAAAVEIVLEGAQDRDVPVSMDPVGPTVASDEVMTSDEPGQGDTAGSLPTEPPAEEASAGAEA